MRRHSAFLVALLTTATIVCGCSGPQNFLHTAGPAAHHLARLGVPVLGVFTLVTIIVWLLIAWICVRQRGTLNEHAPIDANHGQSWILIGGFAIPAAVLAIVFISTMDTLAAFPMEGEHHIAQIRVVGQQWWFNAEYLFEQKNLEVQSPTEIHVPVGQPVDIELQTRDVIHSFWVPKLHGKVDLIPGQPNHIRIQANEPGAYEGECGEFCGVQHANMRIKVIAQPLKDYEQWLNAQRAPATTPTDTAAQHGMQVFNRAACPLCHTVRGTDARGQIGPDLTHVASRTRIAGGMLRNTTANLAAWVTQAQTLKPGSRMPNLAGFNGQELRDLVSYLQTLK